jgi:hypothetical protein
MGKMLVHAHTVPVRCYEKNTVWQCDCGKKFIARWPFDDGWVSLHWVPMRWYHFAGHWNLRKYGSK